MVHRPARRNPSPPPVPRRPTPKQLQSSLARVRRMASSVNERDRPFNPERPGSWRGSSRDLVVNGKREGILSDGTRVAVYHKPGTLDEYTIVPHGSEWDSQARGGMRTMLGASETGRGFSQWTEGQEGRHLGRKVAWSEVPAELRSHIERRVVGEQTPNGRHDAPGGSGRQLVPGYAFEGPDVPNKDLISVPNDDWETVMIGEGDIEDTRFVQYLTIDGARCSVFERKSPPYGYLAQMTNMTRNGDVDPRDIPAHLHGAELRNEPDHNGQDVGYSQGMRSKSAEWFQVEYATGSDYSGGSVNESNYQVLGELLDEHHPEDAMPVVWARTSGGHGTYGIVVRYGDLEDEVREAIDALEDYPLMDEEHHSNLELEQQDAAWEDWGRSEFIKEIAKIQGKDRSALADAITPGEWYSVFHAIMNEANENWEDQQGAGQYIDMKRLAEELTPFIESGKFPQYSTDTDDDALQALYDALPSVEDD